MALKLEGRDDHLKARDFIAFGERHGVRKAVVVSMLKKLTAAIVPWIPKLAQAGLSGQQVIDLSKVMSNRSEELQP